jgi:hypothetical protein
LYIPEHPQEPVGAHQLQAHGHRLANRERITDREVIISPYSLAFDFFYQLLIIYFIKKLKL